MLSIKKGKLTSISIFNISPQITKKQKEAFELAIKESYYAYPRKIDVKHLSRLAGVAFSAFHGRLRKAERSLLPYTYALIS